MGGPRRTAKESVDALEEALAIIRGFWSGERSVSFQGSQAASQMAGCQVSAATT
jgi:hypothetical protein